MNIDTDEIGGFLEEVTKRVIDKKYDFSQCPTLLDRMGPYRKQDVIAALLAADSVIIRAAVLLGRSRGRLKDYIYRNPDVLIWFDDAREGNIDIVEHSQMKAAVTGDLTAGRFILTTLGKDRGYSARLEAVGRDGAPLLPPTLDFSSLSTEALKELQNLGVTTP